MSSLKGFHVRCKSQFNGSPLVVIFTLHSKNSKTGNMVQSWILAEGQSPVATSRARKDFSICGSCRRRHSLGGDCYVSVGRAPQAIWKAYKRGIYPALDLRNPEHLRRLEGRPFRLGAYGDPVAVPFSVWADYLVYFKPSAWTGYTHSWRLPIADRFTVFLMASCDNEGDYQDATRAGWRTFRVRSSGQPLLPGEFECPASEQARNRATVSSVSPAVPVRANGTVVIKSDGTSYEVEWSR